MSENYRIDYSKYQVEELAETISDAVFFPLYIGKVFGFVLVVFMALLTLFAYFFIPNTFLSIFFWLLTFAISLPSVVLFSAIRLFSTIQSDIEKVYEITLKTTKDIYNDTGLLKAQRENDIALKTTFSDVFRGVAFFVIKPVLSRVIQKRIKYFAYPFVFIVNVIFKKYISKKSKTLTEDSILNELENNSLEDTKNYRLSGTTFKIIKFPFRLILIVYGLVNYCIVYLLYQLFS